MTIHYPLAAFTSVLSLGILATPALAEINLVGTWTGTGTVINQFGRNNSISTIKIISVENGTIEAERTWRHEGETGNTDAGDVVSTDIESLIGAMNATGSVFYLVENEEAGTYQGRVIDENTFELFHAQPGDFPVASYMIYNRVEE